MALGLGSQLIAELLLDFAPASLCNQIDLTAENQIEWVRDFDLSREFDSQGSCNAVDLSALSLYYATRSLAKIRAFRRNYGVLCIDPTTLGAFAQLTRTEEFDRADDLLASIQLAREKVALAMRQQSAAGARARKDPKYDWVKIGDQVAKYRADGVPEREIAAKIERRFGVPQSTYRDWRKK